MHRQKNWTAGTAVVVLSIVLTMIGATTLVYVVVRGFNPGLFGRFERTGSGSWTVDTLDESMFCANAGVVGGTPALEGVLITNGDGDLRMAAIAHPNAGWLVHIYDDGYMGGKTTTVSRALCSTFDVDVRKTNITLNDVPAIAGTVSVDCGLKDGGRIWGTATFARCHS